MKPHARFCLAQANATVGDLEGNFRKIADALGVARRGGASLVVFPELALTGYPPEDLLFQGGFVSANLRALAHLGVHTRRLSALVGFVDRGPDDRLYNAAAFFRNGRLESVYRKNQLPNYGVFDERRYFHPGAEPLVVDIQGFRVGVTICEDIWQEESFVYRPEYAGSVDVIANLSASPYHRGKQSEREKLLKKLAARTRATVLYANLVGGQDELVFDGGSVAMDPEGRVLGAAKRFEEDLIWVDPRSKRGARPERPLSDEDEVYHALTLGTRDYVRKNGFSKVAIGLSGGIDSALVARIAVDALGAENVLGVTMPSPYSSKGTLRDAWTLAKSFGIECREIRITPVFEAFLAALAPVFGGRKPDAAEENLQARVRGTLLMALSNKFGHLVLTTGNKSEIATGYCTLYGDMAGGFAPLKDVPKTLVFRLSRRRNALSKKGRIPESILRRPPTAELRHGQKDQDSLPPYPVLDRFIEAFVERDRPVAEIVRTGVPASVAKKTARMIYANEYKRRQAPPGVKITPKAFGRDRRMPLTNGYRP